MSCNFVSDVLLERYALTSSIPWKILANSVRRWFINEADLHIIDMDMTVEPELYSITVWVFPGRTHSSNKPIAASVSGI
jgi:hypothetical protein